MQLRRSSYAVFCVIRCTAAERATIGEEAYLPKHKIQKPNSFSKRQGTIGLLCVLLALLSSKICGKEILSKIGEILKDHESECVCISVSRTISDSTRAFAK